MLLILTSGVRVLGITFAGLSFDSFYAILLIGAIALIISLVVRRKFLFPIKPRTSDCILFAILAIQAIIVIIYFRYYPIFPQFPSNDFMDHVLVSKDLIAGITPKSFPAQANTFQWSPFGIFYGGIEYQISLALILVSGIDLAISEVVMGILVVLSSLLFYLVGEKLFKSPRAGLIIAGAYSFAGPVWFGEVFNTGLYSNFYGVLATMFFIVVMIFFVSEPRKWNYWALVILATVNLLWSHYSSITVYPAMIVYAVAVYLNQKKNNNKLNLTLSLTPLVVPILGAGIVALSLSHIRIVIERLFVQAGSSTVEGSTFFSSLFSGFPFLSYTALFSSDIPFLAVLILSLAGVYFGLRRKEFSKLLVPIVWFLTLAIGSLLVSPLNQWRFSIVALIPLTITSGYGIYTLIERYALQGRSVEEKGKTTEQHPILVPWKAIVIIVITLGALFIGSWGQSVLTLGVTSNPSSYSAQQNDVYSAIMWLGNNTANGSNYLSVSDWRFEYTILFNNHSTYYNPASDLPSAISLANYYKCSYIIVTNLMSGYPAPQYGETPWQTFPHSSADNATLVYSNADVEIFQVNGTSG